MSDIVFLDTETTGLSLDDDIWEFAAIRRTPNGIERTLHIQIEHDLDKAARLPQSFRADHDRRYSPIAAHSPEVAALMIDAALAPDDTTSKVHIVGAVPNFVTERIALLLRRFGIEPRWHHHLIDVEALAVGWLHGKYDAPRNLEATALPWNSDDLSRACGVEPPAEADRHTAMGDTLWVKRLYDHIMGVTEA